MHPRKDTEWNVQGTSIPEIQLILLMDLRDELKRLNSLLHCHNFTSLPYKLQEIRNAILVLRRKKKRRKRKA